MPKVVTAATLAEAQAALGPEAHVIGGGTLLMRAVNYGAAGIGRLVRVLDPALREVRVEGERVRIGAGVTMAEVMAHRDLEALAPVARSVGGPAVRCMATVGGNLFARSPYGDFTVALLALDAEVHWSDGRREPLEAMLAARDRARGVVAAVSVPRVRAGALRYRKVSRTKPRGASVMAIAAWLPGSAGTVGEARIAFGAMGPTAVRAKAAEAALRGARLDAAGIAPALAMCLDGLSPEDDALASAWYRREVAPVHLKRLLTEGR